ncbi:hypothetical protein CP533_5005 [Ophiocordyceps camponoti-saundersi (nom. inval.)]|nr:hypothetical protein CP533_5005 [Ophiocordyceps camponoti-saundersi (nom. inval.)]
MKQPKKDGRSSTSGIADARFASFETDPRYRLPSKKHTKTTIDKRFSAMLVEEDFISNAKVDRYGRKIKSDSKKKALERLYRVESEDEEDEDEDENENTDDQGDMDDEEIVQRELRAAHELDIRKKRDPARDGGFSCSESDSSSDDESGEEGEEGVDSHHGMHRFQEEQAEVEIGQVTKRIAVVNLDWDHIKSTDLMALFSSFVPPTSGRIIDVSIYPSEFGKEHMQQEEIEGPPKALFKDKSRVGAGSDDDDDSDSDEAIKKELIEEGDDQDFDSDALRSYQLDRLRYYYAVVVCSDPETAHAIYEATDGTEYQASSNFIDLRFVPDDVVFDDEPRDQCSEVPDSYKPVEFVTNALQSSKVKLTWDMHPEAASRQKSIKKAFSQSRADLEESDLRTYLASDSEDEVDDEAGDEAIMTRREIARKKMREALGITDDAAAKRSKDGPVGEMQITFAPALAGGREEETAQEETTIDKYKRKERERKEKKRQGSKANAEAEEESKDDQADEDLGFDDPFFTTDQPASAAASKSAIRKEERRKRREAREAAEAESAEQKAKLSGIMGEEADGLEHFDMKEIVRAEKDKGKRRKKKKMTREEGKEGLMQEGFEMDLGDDRFQAVFDSHEFAIDPSNPKFKATSGMKKLLEEVREKKQRSNKRKAGDEMEGRKKTKKEKQRR